ncbi:ROK family transcriptional regulator [Tuberibacillus sp. Marseille-P3662]|uniref:ROK family transcriptional regulator n=1 Tax=Tuberibacillus sp. Marseille-P3662 TaxID=1965358 RepID=UPI000A1CEA0F|nr:ROK family transcriptional regulator [Tuberibacillus sp. Marseille-P3662]
MKKNQSFIKKENQNLILELIQNYDLITRPKLARLADMSPTTVSRIVSFLIEEGLIKETNQYTTGVGRKATYLALNPDSLMSIGVELDERHVRYGIFDFLGKAIVTEETGKELGEAPESLVMKLNEVITRLIQENQIDKNKITGVCVGLPGLVNHKDGNVIKSAQLVWENVPLLRILEEQLEFPVLIDNELNLRAYAERLFIKNKTSHSMVVIGFGSGVGSALMIGDQIYRGKLNSAGEIGHTIVDPNGILCTCGNFGCLQTCIAESFLVQEASKKSNVQSLHEISSAAEKGHKWAMNILNRAITYAAITVNSCVCMNNPDRVILTGKMIEQFPHIRDRILQESRNKIWAPLSDSTSIEISQLGEQGVVLGASMYSQREYINHLSIEKELV